jgi:catechol-2,3-dioxygenase
MEGTPVLYEAERRFTRGLHVLDPDGNEIELYVDVRDTCSVCGVLGLGGS